MTKKKKTTARKPKKSNAGRPPKINPDIVRKLTEGFQDDFTVEEACRFAGIA